MTLGDNVPYFPVPQEFDCAGVTYRDKVALDIFARLAVYAFSERAINGERADQIDQYARFAFEAADSFMEARQGDAYRVKITTEQRGTDETVSARS